MTISLSNERQFGFVIAYLIPGFLIVNGMALVSKTVANWLAVATAPTLGGFFLHHLAEPFAWACLQHHSVAAFGFLARMDWIES